MYKSRIAYSIVKLKISIMIQSKLKRFIPLLLLGFAQISNAQDNKGFHVNLPEFKKDTFNIMKYGAINDGFTLNTKAITDAITACTNNGGGVVMVPEGFWLTGPIELKSNVDLFISKNGTLQFTADFNEFKLVQGNWEGFAQMRNQSPVSATNAVNIGITGRGIIDGNGDAWRMVRKDKLNETQWKKLVTSGGVLSDDGKTWYPSDKSLAGSKMKNPGEITPDKTPEFYASIKDFLRPNLVVLNNCKKILLDGITFENSPAWCLHPLLCEDLTVRNIYAKNPFYAQNGDGIDVESCNHVLIDNSTFDVGDDGICVKSGRDEAGRKRGKPTENMVVQNCVVYHAHGGFVIGSEMSGGARNILVSKCTFIGTDVGLRFKTTRGRGGVVENIFIQDIYMKDIVGDAISFDAYYQAQDPVALVGEKRELPKVEFKPVDETTPVFRNFTISHVVCNGASRAIFFRGLPEMHVKDMSLENMTLQADKGFDIQEASGISFKNIRVFSKVSNPVIDVVQSDKLVFDNIRYKAGADLLFRINGERANGIEIRNTDTSRAKEKISFEFGATDKSVSF